MQFYCILLLSCLLDTGTCILHYLFLHIAGNSGLTYVIQVISKLLDPKTSEFTASFVGKLVTVVLLKVGGQLGEQMDLILRAVLSKMQQTETLSVMQVGDYGCHGN